MQNKKCNSSKTKALISGASVWQRNNYFPTILLNGAKRKGSNHHPQALKQLVRMLNYHVPVVQTDADIIPHELLITD